MSSPILQFLLLKSTDIMMSRKLNGRMKGSVRLDKHFPGYLTPPRPTRHLHQELKHPLRCSEVRQVQRCIYPHHPNASHFRKMQSLCDHLGSKKNIRSSLPEGR